MANGIVYFGADFPDGTLYALDAGTGALVWSASVGQGVYFSSPAVANGIVYFGGEGSYLYAFNALTGAVIWRSTNHNLDAYGSSPTVANGVVYTGPDFMGLSTPSTLLRERFCGGTA